MTDGSQVRQTWYAALSDAETTLKTLLTSSASEWKRISPASNTVTKKGKGRLSSVPELTDVIVHRNIAVSGVDLYRLVLEVQTSDEAASLEPWKAVLTTPELRQEWDPAVDEAHMLEMVDQTTRVCKTNFSLGWPANPRDSVTISRTFHDLTTIIDISTSLPRSSDEPAYLRPSPPFVRSYVKLFAWCIQFIQGPSSLPSTNNDTPMKKSVAGSKTRITCFWQHDLKTVWGLTSTPGIVQQLSTMTISLFKTVIKRGSRVPRLSGYGNGVSIDRVRYQLDRAALTIDYSIIPDDNDHVSADHSSGIEEVQTLRESRRLTRSIESVLPSVEGWDVRVTLKGSTEEVEKLPWGANALRVARDSVQAVPQQTLLRITHGALTDELSVLKVKVVIEVSGSTPGLRLNGLPTQILDVEERDPSSHLVPQKLLQDIASTVDLSFQTSSSISTTISTSTPDSTVQVVSRPQEERAPAAEKTILSRVRRNYIYFSSLLQEPEAKWRRTTDARGVAVTQLDSIDPTLVVYRAEATFVGVGLWDLFGVVVSPGARAYWDKQHDDAVLLEDVNELTELWHFKSKPAWPVNGRDSVVLKTIYKSSTAIHVFSFSADDSHLFSNIPAVDPNIIRTQVDLQGWAIEALSPTTTLLTLLEQSDPKGWTNKTAIPTQMINMLSGIGEFAIKCGGPPIMTRLTGAKASSLKYDHERMSFKVEYEPSISRHANSQGGLNTDLPSIECELRCDIDTWAGSLDIVVDPPPQTISCLRRHRLSSDGGGIWLTMAHDSLFVDDERLLAIVRRAPGKEKGLVMVNGARIHVDVEEISDHEIKSLAKRKRVKPPRIPLDQPPIDSVIRRRKAEWSADEEGEKNLTSGEPVAPTGTWASAPRISSPLTRFLTYAVEQATSTTQQAVAAISPVGTAGSLSYASASKHPMQYALEALSWAQEFNSQTLRDGWFPVSEKGMVVQRKMAPEISPFIPVHKGVKIVEGVSAEELASVLQEYDCRKIWDERFESAKMFESFGAECRTSFLIAKGGFPFRDRGFYLASVLARGQTTFPSITSRRSTDEITDQCGGTRNAIFFVSASFNPESTTVFSQKKYNPYQLPIGRVYVDAWILETLDPYTKENYAIPSTRCTRLVSVDYAGSIPAAVNSMINATLARSILTLESYIKSISPLPTTRLPAPGLVIMEKKGPELLIASAWRLRRRDEFRTLIGSTFNLEKKVYHTTVYVSMPGASNRPGLVQTTPRPDEMTRSNPIPTISPADEGKNPEPSRRDFPMKILSNESRLSINESSATDWQSTSVFTPKGEVRPSTDLIVAELVVDSKLYPNGYDVQVFSRARSCVTLGLTGQPVSLRLPSDTDSEENILPLIYTVHTLPSSPLHSSGLNAEGPSRQLLRLMLPTAQYQISTVDDPLTGETQTAPPKPAWFLALQQEGAFVYVEVQPRTGEPAGGVRVDGRTVAVISEKDSLTSLGRDELLDDGVSRMGMLTRIPDEAEPLPDDLRVPIAVADDLFDPPATASVPDGPSTEQADDENSATDAIDDVEGYPNVESTPSSQITHPAPPGRSGLMSFFQSYPNPLTRFTGSSAVAAPVTVVAGNSCVTANPQSPPQVPGGLVDVDTVQDGVQHAPKMYPLSQLVAVAVIAFLVGSLLRSLLSPADFVYVVTDLSEAEAAGNVRGWREMRRLIEVKYALGGWDFQVAAIRRH